MVSSKLIFYKNLSYIITYTYLCIPGNLFQISFYSIGNNGDKGDRGDRGDKGDKGDAGMFHITDKCFFILIVKMEDFDWSIQCQTLYYPPQRH